MSIPATVRKITQFGVETTAGTPVTPTKVPFALTIAPNYEAEGFESVTPLGSLAPVAVAPGILWAAGSAEGRINVPDIVYLLAASFGAVTPSQVMDGSTATGAYRWQWTLAGSMTLTPKTLTLEVGIPGGTGFRVAGAAFTNLEFSFEKGNPSVSADLIGNKPEHGITLAGGATRLARALLDPRTVQVLLATTPSGLDTATPLGRVVSATVSLGEHLAAQTFLGRTDIERVPQAIEPELTLSLAMDAEGYARIGEFVNASRVFVRVAGRGPLIYDGASLDVYHSLQLDLAVEWKAVDITGDEDGVWSAELTGGIVDDTALGGFATITATTTLSTL